ncbi:MAG: RHS repeat-associated core domain-containing protein, partial [Acidimicrobiales bacterium]
NLDGDVTGITYPLGAGATWASTDTVDYTYNHADEMTSVADFNGNTSDVTNTADGLPSALTLGSSGDTVTTDYGANDEPSSITLGDGSTLQEFAYSDVPSGGVAGETDTPSSSLSPADYSYDAQSQVTSDKPGTGSTNDYVEDASGNLTTLPTGATGSYDHASELTSSVLSETTTDYTYDASGNRTAESGGSNVSATYNGASEVTSYSNSAANLSSATYNGDGLRTAASSTPTGGSETIQDFVWNTTTSVPELLMDSTNAYIYGPSGTPFEQVNLSTGAIDYLVSDALGSIRGVVSSGGSLSASASYDAWGNPETMGGLTAFTPFGFVGGYTDPTGLIYFINRYYDPTTGEFVSVDPDVSETGQPYAYAGDDPVDGTDPLGLCFLGGSWCNGIQNTIATSFDSFRHQTASLADYPADVILSAGTAIYNAYDDIYQDGANGCSFFSLATQEGVAGAVLADENAAFLAGGEGEAADASLEAAEAQGGVYTLRDPETGEVVRTGRSSNLAARQVRLANNPVLGEYQFQVEYQTDNYAEQRGLEQMLYDQYPEAQAANGGYNYIRAVSSSNTNLSAYQQAARDYISTLYGG